MNNKGIWDEYRRPKLSFRTVKRIFGGVFLSDYFETTTDFLLKGIAPALVPEKRYSAMMFALIGTVLNAIGREPARSTRRIRHPLTPSGC